MRRSYATNEASTTSPPAIEPHEDGRPNPWSPPSITPYTSAASPAMDISTPTTSTRPGFGSRDSGTISSTATMPSTTIGTLIRKTEPHQ